MPEHMRRHVRAKPSISHDVGKRLLDCGDSFTVPLDGKTLPVPFPAPQVRQEAGGQRDRRLAFFRLKAPRTSAIEHSTLDIDPAAARRRLKSGAAYCACPGARVERHQNEL